MNTQEIKIDEKTGLNQQQLAAYESILDWYYFSDIKFYCLRGYAGTGKTYTVQKIIEAILFNASAKIEDSLDDKLIPEDISLKIAFSAPTHKALGVLKGMAEKQEIKDKVEFHTIHSLLDLRIKEFEAKNVREKTYSRTRERESIFDYDLVVIDECSMIDTEMFDDLLKVSIVPDCPRLLFMGDIAQLPPINEKESRVFSEVHNFSELDLVMRYEGSIAQLVHSIRKNINKDNRSLEIISKDSTLMLLPFPEFIHLLIDEYKANIDNPNRDYLKTLAWTNDKVNGFNKFIRQQVYGYNVEPYLLGEILIANKPIFQVYEYDDGIIVKKQKTKILNTSSEVQIKSIEPIVEKFANSTFSAYQLEAFAFELNKRLVVKVLDPASVNEYNQQLISYRDNKSWKSYYALKELFDPFVYSYALTVHKSQGSTFNKVFVDMQDINGNRKHKERNQCLYVAFSRAKDQLIIT